MEDVKRIEVVADWGYDGTERVVAWGKEVYRDNGPYVRFSDCDRLRAKVERLEHATADALADATAARVALDAERADVERLTAERDVARNTLARIDEAYQIGAESRREHRNDIPPEIEANRNLRAAWNYGWACEGERQLLRCAESERDALARRLRVVEMHIVACRRSDGTYWLDYPSGRIAPVICALNNDARARGYWWSSASAALDAAADALEKAGLMEVGNG